MNEQGKLIIQRLRKPSVLLSILSQILSLLLLFGYDVDANLIMAGAGIICSILATCGILANPDSSKKGFTDDILTCAKSGKKEPHVLVNGQYLCRNCGTVYHDDL